MKKRPLAPNDVVRIMHSECPNETGVINRIDTTTGMISVYNGFATWFFINDLKRIGRISIK